MHVLLPTIGSFGDLFPMLGIGEALRARGHRVTIVASPVHQSTVRLAKLDFEPLGTREEAERLLNNPDLWHPLRGFQITARDGLIPAARALYEIIARHRSEALVVAAHSMALGAQLAHEKLGVPTVALHLQPTLIRSRIAPSKLGVAIPHRAPMWFKEWWYRYVDREVIDAALAGGMNAIRADLGLPPAERLFDQWLHTTSRVVGLFPEWYAPVEADWPTGTTLVGFPLYEMGQAAPLPEAVERFLAAGEPPLLVTFGSAMRHGAAPFAATIEAAQRLGRRAILATRGRDQLPPTLPDGVLHVPYAPFKTLMPRVAALVHHGGIGTLSQALAAGVPQLVMPLSHDQPDNGVRVARLGVGKAIAPRRFNARSAARALHALLDDPAPRRRALALAATMDGPASCAAAADVIERVME